MLDKITGDLKVFSFQNEDKTYRFSASIAHNKNEDGTYTDLYVKVVFSKELRQEVAKVYRNKSFDVIIKEAWLKPYVVKAKDMNLTQLMLFINKATIVINEDKSNDDLPF